MGGGESKDFNLSDEAFNRLATSIQFQVNHSDIDEQSTFLKTYYQSLLPVLLRDNLIPVKIFVRGAASPDGPYANNCRLGAQRTQSLLRLLSQTLGTDSPTNSVKAKVVYEDYAYLADLMDQAHDPAAASVRRLFEQAHWDEPSCKKALQRADGGKLWNRLKAQYFPRLRAARVVICVAPRPTTVTPVIAATPDTVVMRDTLYVKHTTTIIDSSPVRHEPIYNKVRTLKPKTGDDVPRHPLFALKTNLLYDAVTAINGAIEVPLGDRHSLSAEVVWPWWVDNSHNQWCLELGNVGLEWRHYFRKWKRHSTYADWYSEQNAPLQGWFIGLHADGAYYDFEWDGSGRQGEIWFGGVTAGYQKRLSRYLNLELSLGLGGGKYQYRTYDASEDERHLWRDKRYRNKIWIGPTKARISLVWVLYQKCNHKKGGKQ